MWCSIFQTICCLARMALVLLVALEAGAATVALVALG
jgi:hypothetical protein